MSMFPHTVTLYTFQTETDKETIEEKLVNYITVLRGVLLDESKAANVRKSGIESADAANLYIPADVEAVDGLTQERKEYAGPMAFWESEDKTGLWTLTTGGNTFFVFGEVVEPEASIDLISLEHDTVYTVSKADHKNFGGLQHWEVGGK